MFEHPGPGSQTVGIPVLHSSFSNINMANLKNNFGNLHYPIKFNIKESRYCMAKAYLKMIYKLGTQWPELRY